MASFKGKSGAPHWLIATLVGAQLAGCTIGESVLAPLRTDAGDSSMMDGSGGDGGDAGADTGVDTGVEIDTGVDSGVATDTGVDSGVPEDVQDSGADTGVADTGVDTGVIVDTGVDTGADVPSPCAAGEMRCSGVCTNVTSNTSNCGMCGVVCTGGANAAAACSMGVCSLTCNTGFGNCDGNAANGCETNTTNDVANCGACGTMCPNPPNAVGTCSMSMCSYSCGRGFVDCDRVALNGCEVNVQVDRNNCGGCGTVCPTGATCTAGACMCALGTTSCSGACVNLASDTNNCGACGTRCPAGQVCGGGTCRAICASGETLCGTQCVRLGDDVNNCGACGTRCASTETCAAGLCVPVVSIDPIGCADGARDSFTNRTTFPNIAGCSGAWSLPGIFPAIPRSALAVCATLGDDSTMAPANGLGCASSNLCAPGWHICNGGEIGTRTATMGCAATTDYPTGTFYAASVSGTGCNVCALRSGTMTGAACTGTSCQAGCRESGDLNNDFFGCGVIGSAIAAAGCDGLTRASGDNCGSLTSPWLCGGSTMESRTVTKTGSAAGGVLCCRD